MPPVTHTFKRTYVCVCYFFLCVLFRRIKLEITGSFFVCLILYLDFFSRDEKWEIVFNYQNVVHEIQLVLLRSHDAAVCPG